MSEIEDYGYCNNSQGIDNANPKNLFKEEIEQEKVKHKADSKSSKPNTPKEDIIRSIIVEKVKSNILQKIKKEEIKKSGGSTKSSTKIQQNTNASENFAKNTKEFINASEGDINKKKHKPQITYNEAKNISEKKSEISKDANIEKTKSETKTKKKESKSIHEIKTVKKLSGNITETKKKASKASLENETKKSKHQMSVDKIETEKDGNIPEKEIEKSDKKESNANEKGDKLESGVKAAGSQKELNVSEKGDKKEGNKGEQSSASEKEDKNQSSASNFSAKNVPKNYEDQLTVVANEMKGVLQDLKTHLLHLNSKKTIEQDSFSNVVPEIEAAYKTSISRPSSANKPQPSSANDDKFNNTKDRTKTRNVTPNPAGPGKNVNVKLVKNPANRNATTKSVPNASKRDESVNRAKSAVGKKRMSESKTYASIDKNKKLNQWKVVPRSPRSESRSKKPQVLTLSDLKAKVQEAIKHRRTFTLRGGWETVRRALVSRGWVEKLVQEQGMNANIRRFMSYTITELNQLMKIEELRDCCRRIILSKLLEKNQVDLYWSSRYQYFQEYKDNAKLTLINRFRRDVFSYTSKGGLCEGSKQEYWFRIPNVAGINHPRTYRLTTDGDTPSFVKDYRITAAMSLLKWVVKMHETQQQKVVSPSGKIAMEFFSFAVTECYKFIKRKMHEDIDSIIADAPEHEWKQFLEAFYKIIHIGNHFKKDKSSTETDMVRKSVYILKTIDEFWPYLKMDGFMNIWILKPINSSMGIGIIVCRDLNYMLNYVKTNTRRRYIVQKYIERPLLIHNTKFDIRQWFLITSSSPLTIWMYKSCYLRFSSQTYNLNNLHEAVHLTNNSIQKKYMSHMFDPALPSYLMWDSKQFQKYLSDIGFPKAYQNIIYPEMKKCFTAAVLMLQDKMDKRVNCFELYGADFMITEDFKAWLIEINSNPALFNSTPVTKAMCPRVLEDVIKVVIDHARDPTRPTGDFEMVYRQKEKHFQKTKVDLKLCGKPAPENYFAHSTSEIVNQEMNKTSADTAEEAKDPAAVTNTKESLNNFGKGMRQTLENLQQLIKMEKLRRTSRKNFATETVDTSPEKVAQETNCNMYLEFYDDNVKDEFESAVSFEDRSGDVAIEEPAKTVEADEGKNGEVSEGEKSDLQMQMEEPNCDNFLDGESITKTLNDLLSLIRREKARRLRNSDSFEMPVKENIAMDSEIVKDVILNLKNEGNTNFLSRIKSLSFHLN